MRDRDKPTTPVAAPTGRWRALAARCLNPGGTTLSSRLRNALFVLFLGGILAYGAGFAWYMLARFDLINLIRDVNGDDSFYYFQIASNLAEGEFSTFDGGITRTNGYHPLWMFLITPFYWVFDKEAALFAIKAFEIMLIAGGVALIAVAARLARLPWILLCTQLWLLYQYTSLYQGLEAAAALFMLALFFLAVMLYVRDSRRWQWPLAAVAFSLPWVRLEYVAISLAATAVLGFIEWSWREQTGCRARKGRSVRALNAVAPMVGAIGGILVYFAYNGIIFGGVTPVSGATKQMVSERLWEQEGGYDFVQNFREVLQFSVFDYELRVALEVCAYVVLIWWFARRSRGWTDWLPLAFLVCVFGLAVGHLTKFAQTVLTVHPSLGNYSWYFVPAYLMMAMIVPVRFYVAIHFVRRFIGPRSHRAANILCLGIAVVGTVFLLAKAEFTSPFRMVDQKSGATVREWEITSHMGVQVMDRLLPENSVVGSWDAGVIGYFSRFPVVNQDGLVNSYDYLRAYREETRATLDRDYGITHHANVVDINASDLPADRILFEGPIYIDPWGKRRFMLWPRDPPPSGFDRSANFWEKMAPHFDYQSESVAVVVDGNMAQAFTKDCAPAETHDESLVLSWPTGEGETVSRVWRPWEDAGSKNSMGFCVNAFELPNDAHPPIRIRTAPAFHIGNHLYLGEQALARFEDGFDGWLLEGEAVTNHNQHERYGGQQPISGNAGRGFLTSYHPDKGDRTTGRALSPAFTASAGQYLAFLIAGGRGDGVGARLLADGEEAAVWQGENTERFQRVVYPLAEVAGQRLQLEMFDDESGGWGHIMLDQVMLAAPAFHIGNHLYLGEQALARFEDGFDGWLLEGEAITNHNQHERYGGQQPISGNAGRGFLTSYHPDTGDRPTGRALSPAFTASPGQYLAFLIAGGRGDGVGVRLLADGDEAAIWRGENTEQFKRVVYPLAEVAGQRLQLEMFDDESGGWGHIMLDQVMLARRQSDSSPVRFETMSDGDYLTWLTGGSTPIIRSDWDVYLVGDSLLYAKDQCSPEDTEPEFFVHLNPVDMNDLPSHRKQYGFDGFNFDLRDHLFDGRVCTAKRGLPVRDYAIAAIRTGQFLVNEDGSTTHLWEGEIRFDE